MDPSIPVGYILVQLVFAYNLAIKLVLLNDVLISTLEAREAWITDDDYEHTRGQTKQGLDQDRFEDLVLIFRN